MDFRKRNLSDPKDESGRDPQNSKTLPLSPQNVSCGCVTMPTYQLPFNVASNTRLTLHNDERTSLAPNYYMPDCSTQTSLQVFSPNSLTASGMRAYSPNGTTVKPALLDLGAGKTQAKDSASPVSPNEQSQLLCWFNALQLYKEKLMMEWQHQVFSMVNAAGVAPLSAEQLEKNSEIFRPQQREAPPNVLLNQTHKLSIDSLLFKQRNGGQSVKSPKPSLSNRADAVPLDVWSQNGYYSGEQNGSHFQAQCASQRSAGSPTTSSKDNIFTYAPSSIGNNIISSRGISYPSYPACSSPTTSKGIDKIRENKASPLSHMSSSPSLVNQRFMQSLYNDLPVSSPGFKQSQGEQRRDASPESSIQRTNHTFPGTSSMESAFSKVVWDSTEEQQKQQLCIVKGRQQDGNYRKKSSTHEQDNDVSPAPVPLNLVVRQNEQTCKQQKTSPNSSASLSHQQRSSEASLQIVNFEFSNGEPSRLAASKSTSSRKGSLEKTKNSSSSSSSGSNGDKFTPPKRYKRYSKPPFSYVALIVLAIASSKNKRLQLSQILTRIAEMFPFFRGTYQGWRDSIRHNLSQFECFIKTLKNPFKPHSKGNYWSVDIQAIPHELLLCQNTQVSRGAGHRYCKDISKIFDLETGLILTSVPSCLLSDSGRLKPNPSQVIDVLLREQNVFDCCNDKKQPFHLHEVFESEALVSLENIKEPPLSKKQNNDKVVEVTVHPAPAPAGSSSNGNGKRKIVTDARSFSMDSVVTSYEEVAGELQLMQQQQRYCKRSRTCEI